MKNIFQAIKDKFSSPSYEDLDAEKDYVELDTENVDAKGKVLVRPFLLEDFEDVKPVLDSLREGHTIALVNIKPLKERDLVELKRAVNKLKKTTDAIEGEIAGFGEDYLVVTPSFASIYKGKQTQEVKEQTVVTDDQQ